MYCLKTSRRNTFGHGSNRGELWTKAEPVKRHRLRRPPNSDLKVDEDLVVRMTQYHKEFEFNGATLKNLEKYNDAVPYRVPEEKEVQLLKHEVRRLIVAVQEDTPLLFRFDRQDLDESGARRDLTYGEVNDVVAQVCAGMAIVQLDNSCIAIRHCKNELSESATEFAFHRRYLANRYDTRSSDVRGCEPKQIEPPMRNAELYHSLVNFLTASLARILAQTATGGHWIEQMLSILAAISMKLKILAAGLSDFALTSIDNAGQVMAETKELNEDRKKDSVTIVIDARKSETSELQIADTSNATRTRYHEGKTILSKLVMNLLQTPLEQLTVDKRPMAPDCFENHTALYRTLPSTKPFTVHSSRDGSLNTAQSPFVVDFVQHVMSFTQLTITAVDQECGRRSSSDCTDSSRFSDKKAPPPDDWNVRLNWGSKTSKDHFDLDATPKQLFAKGVDVAVSVIVPLWFAGTGGSQYLRRLITMTKSMASDDDPVMLFEAHAEYSAIYVTVTSRGWWEKTKAARSSQERSHDPSLRSLPQSPWQQRLLNNRIESSSNLDESRDAEFRNRLNTLSRQYEYDKAEMERWTIGRNTIKVKCGGYVTAVMCFAVLIVCGGMAIPFAVGERINGVDPFQLTTFTWVFAVAMLVFFKSWYVSDWPWHDFIQRVVVCHSISDVRDVSRIDAQVILIHLLVTEHKTALFTQGPHNSMFRNTADSGFEIDEPIRIEAMFLSNFVPVKIFDDIGEHLVCLDVRRSAHSLHIARKMKGLAHHDIDEHPEGDGVLKLSKQSFDISRILGVYVGDSSFGGTKHEIKKEE